MVAKLKLKGIDGRAPPGVEPVAQFDSTRKTYHVMIKYDFVVSGEIQG